jgi:hypothetical protein
MDSTCLKVSSDILFMIFGRRNQKLWIFKDLDEIWSENLNESVLDKESPRVAMRFAGTVLFGSRTWSVRSKLDRTDLIGPYPFVLSDLLESLDRDPTDKI